MLDNQAVSTNKNLIVVVDAWETLQPDSKALCSLINVMCKTERARGNTIIHSNTNQPIASCIDTQNDLIIGSVNSLTLDLNQFSKIYLTGFHFGKCVHREYDLLRKIEEQTKIGLVLNLCLPFTSDPWLLHLLPGANRYLWCNLGFQQLN